MNKTFVYQQVPPPSSLILVQMFSGWLRDGLQSTKALMRAYNSIMTSAVFDVALAII